MAEKEKEKQIGLDEQVHMDEIMEMGIHDAKICQFKSAIPKFQTPDDLDFNHE